MRQLITVLIIMCCTSSAFGQKKVKMIVDTFKGKIPGNNKAYITKLMLQHCKYCDDGNFTLEQMPMESVAGAKPIETKGEWTVLKGSAKDENATVVEIDAVKDTLYFLRLKNSDLQMLDNKLRELKPVVKYVLKKQ